MQMSFFLDIEVILGDNSLTATGAVSEPLSLDVNINAENLTQLVPGLSGNVKGSALVKGEYKKPQIESKLSANDLVYGNIKQGKETLIVETDIDVEDDVLTIKKALANLGNNTLEISGNASEPYSGH